MLYRGGRGSRALGNQAEVEWRSAGKVKGTGCGPKVAGEVDCISIGGCKTRKRVLWLAKPVEDVSYIRYCWRVRALRTVASYTSLLQQEDKNEAGD